MNKPPHISVVPHVKAIGNQNAQKLLMDILIMAEEGTIDSVAIACTDASGFTVVTYSETVNKPALLGAIERLKHKMLKDDD